MRKLPLQLRIDKQSSEEVETRGNEMHVHVNQYCYPSFRNPIPVCNDALDRIGTNKHHQLFFISFDSSSGYHQISCTFFGPNFQKWTWTIMLFGPWNGTAVYITFMNEQFRTWFFIVRHTPLLNGAFIDCCQIINDTLMWSDHPSHLVAFFCIALDCLRSYRVSLKLSKCHFSTDKTKLLGHDISSGVFIRPSLNLL